MSFRTLLFNLGGPILYGLFGSLEHAKLTAIKSASGHDTKQSTPLCQNNFGPQKSNIHPLLIIQNPIQMKYNFLGCINFALYNRDP